MAGRLAGGCSSVAVLKNRVTLRYSATPRSTCYKLLRLRYSTMLLRRKSLAMQCLLKAVLAAPPR